MEKRCYRCHERKAAEAGMIDFVYQGLKVRTFKIGGICQGCEEEAFAELFKKYSQLLSYNQEKIISINWKGFCAEIEKERGSELIGLFLNLGIFSLEPAGNWEVVSDMQVPLNPRLQGYMVYFTNEADVVHYAAVKFSQTVYDWVLRKIEKTIARSKLNGLGRLERSAINFDFQN